MTFKFCLMHMCVFVCSFVGICIYSVKVVRGVVFSSICVGCTLAPFSKEVREREREREYICSTLECDLSSFH